MQKKYIFLALLLLLLIPIGFFFFKNQKNKFFLNEAPIRVGILHSLSGTMAISETPTVDAALLAIGEINDAGGILNRKIEPIIVDGRSDQPTFAQKAEELILKDKVAVIFGCWTSACRKILKPVIEKYNSLLIYPLQYEGLEKSSRILYTGSAPNQQIIPAINWAFESLKAKKFFLAGSDYIFPRTANAIIKDQVNALQGEIVGEEYILLGSTDVSEIIKKIKETKPDIIINTINGDSNNAFFNAFREAGLTAEQIPILSFSVAEPEVASIGIENIAGHYAAWNYFESLDSQENKQFIANFKKRFGPHRITSDPLEATYFGVYLWAQAVEDAGTPDPSVVIDTIKMQSFNAPEGIVSVDPDTMHTWKFVRIGKVNREGKFDIVWSSENPIRPNPYPPTRSFVEWTQFLSDLFEGWGRQWSKTEKKN